MQFKSSSPVRQLLTLAAFAFSLAITARATTIDFEGLSDSTFVSTQYSGLTFSNAQILTAGISLDETEAPPKSGVNVVSDFSGPMSILFATPASSIGGYFTYAASLTLTAYDSSGHVIGTVSSSYSNNFALSGDPGSSPNEFLQLAPSSGISKLVITGAASGNSFALDDFTYLTGAVNNSSPEPGALSLLTCGSALVLAWRIRRARIGRS